MGALRTRHNLSFARVRAVKAILTSRGRLDRLAETGYMQWTPFHARNPDCWMKGLFSPAIGKHLATTGDLSGSLQDSSLFITNKGTCLAAGLVSSMLSCNLTQTIVR
jgi:hypothetical protein